MAATIPSEFRDLFSRPAIANLATIMPDGRPQVTPVWCEFDGTHVVFNSVKGRRKHRNVRRDPRVAFEIFDPDNPYRYIEVRGRVVEITEDGADAHIDSLAHKYLGVDRHPRRPPGEVRIIFKVLPERVRTQGLDLRKGKVSE